MNRLLHSLFVTSALLCMIAATAQAQQKTGYVNTDEILKQIPEYTGIQQQLRVVGEDWRQQLDDMQQKIDTLKKEYDAKEILLTDKLRAQKKQQIQTLAQQRRQFMKQKFGPDGQYFQKQKELLKPIQRKVYQAITAVAQRQNIDFVIDRAKNTSLLFARPQWNLNEDVLQELGITLNNK